MTAAILGTGHYLRPLRCLVCSARRTLQTSNFCFRDKYDNNLWYDQGEEPVRRTIDMMTYDFRRVKKRALDAKHDVYRQQGLLTYPMREVMRYEILPFRPEFVIIGGGIIGSAIAWWIKQRARLEDLTVAIIERDDTFAESATVLGVGGIRQQFYLPENVQLSQFSAEFLRNAGEHFRILDNDPPDIQYTPSGYLFLAHNEETAKKLEDNYRMQCDNGAKIKLLNREELTMLYPFMNFDDILMGSIGLEGEGWIDPWALLSALREKNLTLGVQYIKGMVTGFKYKWLGNLDPTGIYPEDEHWRFKHINGVVVQPQQTNASPRIVRFMTCVNAAGPWAGEVARMAGIGCGADLMSVPIPIEPRKRFIYTFHCPDGPRLEMPFMVDPSGVWCRREGLGHTYMCGRNPTAEEDAKIDHTNLAVDEDYFTNTILPVLARRVPVFANAKLKNFWAGYSDYNTWDENPIIGSHLFHENLFTCAGFSGHGIQHAMAVGRAVMEKYLDGAYLNVNLRAFDMNRILRNVKLDPEGFI